MANEKQDNPETVIHAPGTKASQRKISDRLEAAHAILKENVTSSGQESNQVSQLNLIALYYEQLFSKMPRGILAMDLDGNVTTYNKVAEGILMIPREEVVFQPFWKNFTDNVFGFSIRQTLKEKHSPGRSSSSLETEKGYKKQIECEVSFIPQLDGDKHQGESEINGLIILFQDVSEQKQTEMVNQQKQQMNELGDLAAALAHEIRNPLGGIKGFASLLERDLGDRPELKKMASYIIEGTNTLNDLVTKVLNYAKPITTHFENVDLVPLVKHLKNEVLKNESISRNIKIDIRTSHDSIITSVDTHSIRKSLENLINNSIHAMSGGGGTVTVAIDKEERSVNIKVSDTGIGIPPENLKKIFSPFFTTKPDANGFGLPETYKIVQLHGGRIDVSSNVGVGSTFTLKIPNKKLDGQD